MAAALLPPIVVIDASAWVSRVLSTDSNHLAALAWINRHLASNGSLVAPILIVTETAAAISRLTGRRERGHLAAAQLYAMPEISLRPVDQALVDDATFLAADLSLKGADAYYVALAARLALPLVTFDREQLSRTDSVITTIRP